MVVDLAGVDDPEGADGFRLVVPGDALTADADGEDACGETTVAGARCTLTFDLGISQRTVENHRAAIMHRTGARSLPALARLALAAASAGTDRPGEPQAANGAIPQPGHA